MERYPRREIEAVRRPGSPQLEVTKVRGSWRDYLDPVEYSDVEVESQATEDFELTENGLGYDDDDDDEVLIESGDFEPFSDTCGECENDGDETDTDMDGLDLTLFEPARDGLRRCRQCSCPCRPPGGGSGYLMMLSANQDKRGESPGHDPARGQISICEPLRNIRRLVIRKSPSCFSKFGVDFFSRDGNDAKLLKKRKRKKILLVQETSVYNCKMYH